MPGLPLCAGAVTLPTDFLDLSTPNVLGNSARIPVSVCSDFTGVTGLAFHPLFLRDPAKRFVYVRYNRKETCDGGNPSCYDTIIERYHVPPGSGAADPATATLIFEAPNDKIAHSSGQIHFDTNPFSPLDQVLYCAMPDDAPGDATACFCEMEDAQLDASYNGKLLAFHVDMGSPPIIPDKLAKGFRNPFGFSVDLGGSGGSGKGDIWMGDTGPDCTGDIKLFVSGSPSGLNYGWPWQVGDCFNPTNGLRPANCQGDLMCGEPGSPPPYTLPARIVPLSLTNNQKDALLGGYVYRGSRIPALQGQYVFGTFSDAGIYYIDALNPGTGTIEDMTTELEMDDPAKNTYFEAGSFHGLGRDNAGELFVIRTAPTFGQVLNNGRIFALVEE